MATPAPKMLLVFCDGTGMDGLVTYGGSENGGSDQYATNVLRLSRAIKPTRALPDDSVMEQIVFYQSGVGSLADFYGQQVFEDNKLQVYGITVASKIRDTYVFIAENYVAGDQICLFGFSRGAYTARKVAGLIDRIGLLTREKMGDFFKIWINLVKNTQPPPPPPTTPIPIKCVGVWDTVGSVYDGLLPPHPVIDALTIKDTSIPSIVENAFHALSFQENREKFMCTLWTVPEGGLPQGHVFKQVWFPGAHSDVGGGYSRHELADLALFWMAGEISSFVDVDLDFVQNSRQLTPDAPWGESEPNNAYSQTPWAQKPFVGHKTRLEGKQIAKEDFLHASIAVAPTVLKDPKYMITLATLQTSFGPEWNPRFATLNVFEDKCRREWMDGINGTIPAYEKPGDFADLLYSGNQS